MYIAHSRNPLLPAITTSVAVVVLLLNTCVAVLVLVLAVVAIKRKKLRADKAHTVQPHYHNQTGGAEGETTEDIYEEMEEGTSNTEQQWGLYEEMDMGRMEERQYECINEAHTAATHKAGK